MTTPTIDIILQPNSKAVRWNEHVARSQSGNPITSVEIGTTTRLPRPDERPIDILLTSSAIATTVKEGDAMAHCVFGKIHRYRHALWRRDRAYSLLPRIFHFKRHTPPTHEQRLVIRSNLFWSKDTRSI